jgi:DnaJ family protein C protein 19
MIKILVPLLLLVIGFVLARRYIANSQSAKQKKSRQITLALGVFALVMIVLAMTGRMHWVGAALATLAPFLRSLVISVLEHFRKNQEPESTQRPAASSEMSEEEALQILGLKQPFTEDDVIDAHRKLMQKLHPDRGGNDYLAARINEAKEFLLKNKQA